MIPLLPKLGWKERLAYQVYTYGPTGTLRARNQREKQGCSTKLAHEQSEVFHKFCNKVFSPENMYNPDSKRLFLVSSKMQRSITILTLPHTGRINKKGKFRKRMAYSYLELKAEENRKPDRTINQKQIYGTKSLDLEVENNKRVLNYTNFLTL